MKLHILNAIGKDEEPWSLTVWLLPYFFIHQDVSAEDSVNYTIAVGWLFWAVGVEFNW